MTNYERILTRCNNQFILLASHTNKSQVILGIKISDLKTGHFVISTDNRLEMACILTVERALFVNCIIRPAYCTVVELSRVERIGIPEITDNF